MSLSYANGTGASRYRALKRQFDLDDACLEDLKDEMFFGHPMADENDRGFVWTGTSPERELGVDPDTDKEILSQGFVCFDLLKFPSLSLWYNA